MNGRRWITVIAALGALGGCGGAGTDPSDDSSADGGTCPAYMDPAGTDLATPTETFSGNVMQIFHDSCASSLCHGSTTSAQAGLYLGGTDGPVIYANLVGKNSGELPSMALVTAGDPSTSYLMHKMDNDQCMFDAMCTDSGCQHLMPQDGTDPLPAATRDIVRRWISQGAKND